MHPDAHRQRQAALAQLLTDLPTPSEQACLPHDDARAAIEALLRMASVRPDSTAAVYAYQHLADALGAARIGTLASLASQEPGDPSDRGRGDGDARA